MKTPINSQRAPKNRKKKIIWKIFKAAILVMKLFEYIYDFFEQAS